MEMGEGNTLSHSCTGLLAGDVVHRLPCEDTDADQYCSSTAQDSGNGFWVGEIDLVVHSDFPFCLENIYCQANRLRHHQT